MDVDEWNEWGHRSLVICHLLPSSMADPRSSQPVGLAELMWSSRTEDDSLEDGDSPTVVRLVLVLLVDDFHVFQHGPVKGSDWTECSNRTDCRFWGYSRWIN